MTRERFLRARRRLYLGRIGCEPSDAQRALADGMASLEWFALVAEAEGGLVALRESREHRRLFQRLLGDFERSLGVPAKATKPKSLAEIVAEVTESRRQRDEAPA